MHFWIVFDKTFLALVNWDTDKKTFFNITLQVVSDLKKALERKDKILEEKLASEKAVILDEKKQAVDAAQGDIERLRDEVEFLEEKLEECFQQVRYYLVGLCRVLGRTLRCICVIIGEWCFW